MATAIFNMGSEGDPRHHFHKSTLTLDKSEEFESALRMHQNTLTPKEFIEWVEEWHPNLNAYKKRGCYWC